MPRLIKIRIVPSAHKNEIVGETAGGALKIKVKAPPVDGKANEELIKFLGKELGVARDQIEIVKGERCRSKVVRISNF